MGYGRNSKSPSLSRQLSPVSPLVRPPGNAKSAPVVRMRSQVLLSSLALTAFSSPGFARSKFLLLFQISYTISNGRPERSLVAYSIPLRDRPTTYVLMCRLCLCVFFPIQAGGPPSQVSLPLFRCPFDPLLPGSDQRDSRHGCGRRSGYDRGRSAACLDREDLARNHRRRRLEGELQIAACSRSQRRRTVVCRHDER